MKRQRPRLMLVLCGAATFWACGAPYQPLVLCHNSNCTEPANPEEDDTILSLTESLTLQRNGQPLIDGIEVDTFWAGDTGQCLFAHDLPADGAPRVEVLTAAQLISSHFKERGVDGAGLTRQGGPFIVHLELKGHVGKTTAQKHTPAQAEAHADCALAVARELQRGADEAGIDVEILLSSFSPSLLSALVARPSWPASRKLGSHVTLRVSAIQGIPPPFDRQSVPIAGFGPEVEMVMTHPDWLRDGAWEAYRSRRWEVCFWMFSSVAESLDAIEHYRPKWVTTSEATLFVRWLER